VKREKGVSDLVAGLRALLADFPACVQADASVITPEGVLVTIAVTPAFVALRDDHGNVQFVVERDR
jgi:hypothetical protein